MTTGNSPFLDHSYDNDNNQNLYDCFAKIKKGNFNDFPKKINSNLADLITKLLNITPSKRIGMKNIKEITSHPFFKNSYTNEGHLKKPMILKNKKYIKKTEINIENIIPIQFEEIEQFIKINNNLDDIYLRSNTDKQSSY